MSEESQEPVEEVSTMDRLRRLRDEIGLKIHLGSKDAQDEFAHAEKKFHKVAEHAKEVGEEAGDAAKDVAAAAIELAEEVGNAFDRILKKL